MTDPETVVRAPYVRVIGKAVAALDLFLNGERELTLSELARRLGMSRSTVHRLLATMERHQLVDRTESGAYRLGIHLFRLGSAVEVRAVLGRLAEPTLEALAERFAVSTYLSVREGERALCVARVDRGPVRTTTYEVGDTLPLYLGAGPVILLSALPDAEVDRVLARPLTAMTSGTVVSPRALRERVRRIRAEGAAYAADDVQTGLAAMGAPVRDRTGAVVAAVSMVALTQWFEERGAGKTRKTVLARALQEAAAGISSELSPPAG